MYFTVWSLVNIQYVDGFNFDTLIANKKVYPIDDNLLPPIQKTIRSYSPQEKALLYSCGTFLFIVSLKEFYTLIIDQHLLYVDMIWTEYLMIKLCDGTTLFC